MERGASSQFLLHHNTGSPADGNDYRPLETPLKPGSTKRIGCAGGRPTNSDWSYFNQESAGQSARACATLRAMTRHPSDL